MLSAGFDTSFAPLDKNNFAPRFGIGYAFDARSVVRGGYGWFFGQHTPVMMTSSTHTQNAIQIASININCITNPTLCPIYPRIFSRIPANIVAATPGLYVFAKDYRQPFTLQASIQFERELSQNFVF